MKTRLTEENWQRQIFHPDEDRYISNILANISQAILAVRVKDHKTFGVKRKDKRDLVNDQLMFTKVFVSVSQILGVMPPELFLRQDWPGELEYVSLHEKGTLCPGVLVGTAMLQGKQEKDLAYALGKRLTMIRADHLCRWPKIVDNNTELRAFFLAALRLVQPKFPVKPEMEAPVMERAGILNHFMQPQQRETLIEIVRRFFETKVEADLGKWSTAVDYTGTRVGFLMCNDLETAAQNALSEPIAVGSAEPRDKVRDLIQWSISEEYFTLRAQLGLAIG